MYKYFFTALCVVVILCFASCDFFKKQDANNNNTTSDTLTVVKTDTLTNTFLAYAFPQVLDANYPEIKETWKEEARKEESEMQRKEKINEFAEKVNVFITYGKDSSWVQYLSSDSNFTAIEGNVSDSLVLALVNDMVLDSIPNRKNNLVITDNGYNCTVNVSFAQDTIHAFSFRLFLE